MTIAESEAWRPELPGWSFDILPFYRELAEVLEDGAHVVEVGTAWGRSAVFLASELVRLGKRRAVVWCVDTWHTKDPAEMPGRKGIFSTRAQLRTLLEHATDEEAEILRPLRAGSSHAGALFHERELDCVFVDGAHDDGNVACDLAVWGPRVRPGGIFAGHDYACRMWPGVTRAVDLYAQRGSRTLRTWNSIWFFEVPR